MATVIVPKVGQTYRRNDTRLDAPGGVYKLFDAMCGVTFVVERTNDHFVTGNIVIGNGSHQPGGVFCPKRSLFTSDYFVPVE